MERRAVERVGDGHALEAAQQHAQVARDEPERGAQRFAQRVAVDVTEHVPQLVAELKPGQPRLLETDNRVVVPVDTTVRVQVTASDVLHAWSIPAFGVKVDGVPGRLNEIWFGPVKNEGVYYGQCSELCGIRHGFMPIAVEVFSKEKFQAWVAKARREFAADISLSRPRMLAQSATK